MRPDTATIAIEVRFTAEEKREIADSLAVAVADLNTIYGEKKVSDAAFNERIKSKESECDKLASKYNKGCELRDVDCRIRYNTPELGKKSFYNTRTEELIETRDMSVEEKQENLQFPPAPKEKKTKQPEPEPEKPIEITWRYIQDVAATIVTLPAEQQSEAIKDMAGKLAAQILKQGKSAELFPVPPEPKKTKQVAATH
jgi:hypothetical protein